MNVVDIDKNIGDVKPNESEDEFVARGKSVIRKLLTKKFS